jgi:hypothetical protein
VKQGKRVAGFKRNLAPASKWLNNALSVTSLCIIACLAGDNDSPRTTQDDNGQRWQRCATTRAGQSETVDDRGHRQPVDGGSLDAFLLSITHDLIRTETVSEETKELLIEWKSSRA